MNEEKTKEAETLLEITNTVRFQRVRRSEPETGGSLSPSLSSLRLGSVTTGESGRNVGVKVLLRQVT